MWKSKGMNLSMQFCVSKNQTGSACNMWTIFAESGCKHTCIYQKVSTFGKKNYQSAISADNWQIRIINRIDNNIYQNPTPPPPLFKKKKPIPIFISGRLMLKDKIPSVWFIMKIYFKKGTKQNTIQSLR